LGGGVSLLEDESISEFYIMLSVNYCLEDTSEYGNIDTLCYFLNKICYNTINNRYNAFNEAYIEDLRGKSQQNPDINLRYVINTILNLIDEVFFTRA
jgi:hypothetical protein